MARPRSDDARPLHVRVDADTLDVRPGDEPPALSAYAFGSSGRLLARADLKGAEGAELAVPQGAEPDSIRLLVGPRIDREGDSAVLADLMRIGAAERMLRPADVTPSLKLTFPIDRHRWICWLRGLCVVRGTLV